MLRLGRSRSAGGSLGDWWLVPMEADTNNALLFAAPSVPLNRNAALDVLDFDNEA